MEPLDLTLAPPRSARAELAGLMLLPRTIDKLRALLPGGNPGVYLINSKVVGISGYLMLRLGITEEELKRVVADAASEEDVVAWVQTKADPKTYAEISGTISHLQPKHSEDEAFVREMYKEILSEQPDLKYLVDIIDADDRRMFGAVK